MDLFGLLQRCNLAKGGSGSMNLNPVKGKAKSLKQVKTSLKWYNFVLN